MPTLINDRDWSAVNGRVCLVHSFVPLTKLEGGKVVAVPGLPYASVRLRCERDPNEIEAFITHRSDFQTLSAAFGQRTEVPGIHLEVNSDTLGSALTETEEVWIVWSKGNYKGLSRLFARTLPGLIVYVAPKGAFAIQMTESYPTGLVGEAKWKLVAPLASWTPRGLL